MVDWGGGGNWAGHLRHLLSFRLSSHRLIRLVRADVQLHAYSLDALMKM